MADKYVIFSNVNTQSFSNLGNSLVGVFPWNYKRSLSFAQSQMSDHFGDLRNRWNQPVVFKVPSLQKCINSLRSWLIKSRIEAGKFSVVTACKSIDSVWAPFEVQHLKHIVVNFVVIEIDNSAQLIGIQIELPYSSCLNSSEMPYWIHRLKTRSPKDCSVFTLLTL